MLYYIIGGVVLLLLFSLFTARTRVKNLYNKYSKITNDKGVNGKQVAFYAKQKLQLDGLEFSLIDGTMTDCYVPKKKLLCLSEDVANNTSIASVAIVAHELGHAHQHFTGDPMFKLNQLLGKITRLTSRFILPLLIFGLIAHIFKWPTPSLGVTLIIISGVLFAMQVLFKLIIIPVEINASTRALKFLKENQIITAKETPKVKKLLRTAGKTYIVALFDGILTPIRRFNNKIMRS